MFAILLSDRMDPFYQNISSFPTVVFSLVLAVCVVYWLFAVLGLVDIDILDASLPLEVAGADLQADVSGTGANAVAGLLMRYQLTGVPVTITVTLIALVGWLVSYYSVHFLFPMIPGRLLEYLAGIPIVAVSLYVGVRVAGLVVRPLRPFFASLENDETKPILGQTARVRTSVVDGRFGEAILEDGGAGLILKVRATGDTVHHKDDRVVLLEYDQADNAYRVVSEQEFNGL